MPAVPKVAIACQGGGSHAAFAAGVLLRLLAADMRRRFELVALSGTSGGAMCASLAWAGLIGQGADAARDRLQRFWGDLEVHDVLDAMVNFWSVFYARLPVTAEVSPYTYEPVAEGRLRELLQDYLALERLPAGARKRKPKLLVGATDIQTGDRVVFDGEGLSYDRLVASAAVPPIFRAVKADGRLYWDGLFSSNPPVREFTDLAEPPDEIWVVQINPQRRDKEPTTAREIADRRNELSGNLSLGQELYFITKVNQLLAAHPGLGSRYKGIAIRVVELDLPDLDYPSKLDRSSDLIARLRAHGEARAEMFFSNDSLWPRDGCAPAKSIRLTAGD